MLWVYSITSVCSSTFEAKVVCRLDISYICFSISLVLSTRVSKSFDSLMFSCSSSCLSVSVSSNPSLPSLLLYLVPILNRLIECFLLVGADSPTTTSLDDPSADPLPRFNSGAVWYRCTSFAVMHIQRHLRFESFCCRCKLTHPLKICSSKALWNNGASEISVPLVSLLL